MKQASAKQTALTAFQLSEEKACAGYLAARNAMKTAAVRLASHRQLAAEQPKRVDYRKAYYQALKDFNAANARTRRAYDIYIHAQERTDAQRATTQGRYPRVLAAADGANKVA